MHKIDSSAAPPEGHPTEPTKRKPLMLAFPDLPPLRLTAKRAEHEMNQKLAKVLKDNT